jgi:hypothetical protein
MAMEAETFSSRRVGATGHDICDPDAQVIGWTVTEYWAARIIALLNGAGDGDLSLSASWNQVFAPMRERQDRPPSHRYP